MAALAKDRNTKHRRSADRFSDPVGAAKKIYAGALVCIDSADGYLKPGAVSTTLVARGIAQEQVDNTAGANGDLSCESESQLAHLAQDGTIARDDIGKDCYIVDDQTVALGDGGATRSKAGKIYDVDDTGVWVGVGIGL